MPRKLHIGGKVRTEGWEVLNAIPDSYVDHVCNAVDLSQFGDGTFAEIYSSHVVEHFDYLNELTDTLKEWLRVLEPGGKLYISTPNLEALATLFLRKDLTFEERFHVMRMIFGGHVSEYDYHAVGLDTEILASYLFTAGFVNIRRSHPFDMFPDNSDMKYKDVLVSLNMIAEKPV